MGNCCKSAQVGHTKSSNIASTPGTSKYNRKDGGQSGFSAAKTRYSYSLSGSSHQLNPNGLILPTRELRVFTFAELRNATNNFDSVLGEGGFGDVYKGWIDEKSTSGSSGRYAVAVKKSISESIHEFEAWQCEVNFLGRLQHPNLLRLLGYCWEDEKLLLVYEFMQNHSLDKHLFGKGSAIELLSWNVRLRILLGAARGLAFLHSSVSRIIYRDFKASNILLDGDYNAKLSHFGLAKSGPTGSASHVITDVLGTYGYAAPEYVATGRLYVKSDVYSFGVVLLEMLTGQRAWDVNRPSAQHNLVDWSKPYLSNRRRLRRIMDPRLENRFPPKAATQAAQLTLKCLGSEPRVRPSMEEVVESLERIREIKN